MKRAISRCSKSGAIVLHIAERHSGLLPDDANARARAITWMFAALSTVEPLIVEREIATYTERGKAWYEERLPVLDDRVRVRLDELSRRLGDADWLDGAFSAGDLLMVTVLRRLEGSGILERISGPVRLYRPRRSTARLQACFRRSAGGFHRQATHRLTRSAVRRRWPGRRRCAAAADRRLVDDAGGAVAVPGGGLDRERGGPAGSGLSQLRPGPAPALCRRACAEDGGCRAYTYVRPGVQGAAARWRRARSGPHLCCASGTRLR